MHDSSMLRMECFINYYCILHGGRVLDVGGSDVNGTYKPLFTKAGFEYVSLDISMGPNVDVVPESMYDWGIIEDESFDYVVSGQAFEHIEYPWLTICEMKKKLKRDGLICIIAPNGLGEHRFPVDCWRFYSDGMRALAGWCGLEVIEVSVGGVPDLYSTKRFDDKWNDVCMVACKNPDIKNKFKNKQMFPVERRFDEYSDLKLQNEFLGQWKCDEDKFDRLIMGYVKRNQYRYIYILGEGYLASAVCGLFNKHHVECECIDEDSLAVRRKSSGNRHILYIVTTIDSHRAIRHRVKKVINGADVQYLDYLVRKEEFYQQIAGLEKECRNVYIYGAGYNGKIIRNLLINYKITFAGFVVSDDRINTVVSDEKVYRISEIPRESGIIVSPFDREEIYKNLKDMEFQHVLDGLPMIKNGEIYEE